MDFILFVSKYSEHCGALLQEIPLLQDKLVCVDNVECRARLRGLSYQVRRVPTLFVTDGINKIIKVLEGVQEIRNWFLLVTYSMSSPQLEPQQQQHQQAEVSEDFNYVDELLPPSTALVGSDEPSDYILKGTKTGDVKSLAEELQRDRESFLETSGGASRGMGGMTRL